MENEEEIRCSFCFKLKTEVKGMVKSPFVFLAPPTNKYICNECVDKFKAELNDNQSTKIPTE